MQVKVTEDHCQWHNLKQHLNHLVTINFIDNWLQYFEGNYNRRIYLYKQKTSELFNNIPLSLTPRKIYDYKNYKTTIKLLGVGWFINYLNYKILPINIRGLSKKEQTKEHKRKEI